MFRPVVIMASYFNPALANPSDIELGYQESCLGKSEVARNEIDSILTW